MARYVSVVGGYEVDQTALDEAHEVGRLLAAAGAIVVTGGRQGIAAAASRGASEAGGLTLGILPERDRSQANPWVQVAVPTGLGETRNALVVLGADAVIAFPGAYGTLSEIVFALLERRPVVGLKTWDLGAEVDVVQVETPAEAVSLALALADEQDAAG